MSVSFIDDSKVFVSEKSDPLLKSKLGDQFVLTSSPDIEFGFGDASQTQPDSLNSWLDVPSLFGPNIEPQGIHQAMDIIGQIANDMRLSLSEAWHLQIKQIKENGYHAAKLAWSQGLANAIGSIVGGASGFAFAGAGIASLNRPHGKWSHSDSSATTQNTLNGKDMEFRKLDLDTPFGDPRVFTAKGAKEQWPSGQTTLRERWDGWRGHPKKKTELETDFLRRDETGRPKIVSLKQKVYPIENRLADGSFETYSPTPVEGKANLFQFKNTSGETLGLKSDGKVHAIKMDDGQPVDADFKPFSYDGTGRYYVGGQEVTRGTANNIEFPSINYRGKTVNGGENPELKFAGAPVDRDVYAAQLRPATTGLDGSVKLNRNMKGDYYYILDEKGANGVPKKISIEGTGDVQQNLEMLNTTERYQSSQNWTQLGQGLQTIFQGTGSLIASGFEREKIEVETDKEIASNRAGEIMQYRGEMSATLTKAAQSLDAIGGAEVQAIISA